MIQWYRVPEDRPFLPVGTIFTSWDWDYWNNFREPFKGEVIAQGEVAGEPRPYTNGEDSTATVFTGDYCGSPAEWTGEALTVPPLPLVLTKDCCKHGPITLICRAVFAAGGPIAFRSEFSAPWNGFGVLRPPFPGPDDGFPVLVGGPCAWQQEVRPSNPEGRWSAAATKEGRVRRLRMGVVSSGPPPLPVVSYSTSWMVSEGDLWDGYLPRVLTKDPGSDALFPFWDWPPVIIVEGSEA